MSHEPVIESSGENRSVQLRITLVGHHADLSPFASAGFTDLEVEAKASPPPSPELGFTKQKH